MTLASEINQTITSVVVESQRNTARMLRLLGHEEAAGIVEQLADEIERPSA
jgi:hypothetical protein